MPDPTTLMILTALSGALVAVVAALGKFSHRLGDRTVDRLYYLSYACTAVSALLFIMRGLFTKRS